MAMTCLILGGTGFAGSHFLGHAMNATDWQFIVTHGSHVSSLPDRLVNVRRNDRVRFAAKDLTRPFTAAEAQALDPVDHIVCYAAEADPATSVDDPVTLVQANTAIALTTFELARALRPRQVTWISTAEALGPASSAQDPGHGEWSTHLPGSPYAASKAAQEDIAFAYWRTYEVPIVIARTMNLYGERQPPGKLIPVLMRRLLAQEPVAVIADEHGAPSTRKYLHARSLAEAACFLLATVPPAQPGRPPVVNVAGERRSVLEIARAVAKCLGQPLAYELVPAAGQRPGHEPHYALDGTLLASLGWAPSASFEEGLRQTVTWYLNHPEWLYP